MRRWKGAGSAQRVRLDFVFWSFIWPLWLLTMASALLGALVWYRHDEPWAGE